MFQIVLRFYEELNDFLPVERRKVPFSHTLKHTAAIKDVIEACGVPHTEVDLILVNQHSVDFAYRVQPDDYISVYPVFEAFDIAPLIRLRPKPLRETRFILDVHLGKLAAYLRFLGYDTFYHNDYTDETLAQISADERRILLTRDRGLLKRRQITHGYYVRATIPKHQLAEIVHRFHLTFQEDIPGRCSLCNNILVPIDKHTIIHQLPIRIQTSVQQFYYCHQCQKPYWKGSHYYHMRQYLQEILR